jgi:two-component system, chemotaxis family, sensor kinase CheA
MSTMIADPELRELFDAECAEHLQVLEAQLLVLEKDPANQTALEESFRRAHSLKGAARMVGAVHVEVVAHRFEDTLAGARNHVAELSSETIDRMCEALDALGKLATEWATGIASGIQVSEVLDQLSGLSPGASRPLNGHTPAPTERTAAPAPAPASTIDLDRLADLFSESTSPKISLDEAEEALAPTPAIQPAPPESSEGKAPGFKLETVRVKPQQLDTLMTLAGEMTVTKIQMGRWASDLEELGSVWEEWQRDLPASGLNDERRARATAMLQRLLRKSHEDHARLDYVTTELEENIRSVRLLPLNTIFQIFPRMVRDLAREQQKEVQFIIEGGDVAADKRILEEMKDPLMHVLRNAVDHGLETAEAPPSPPPHPPKPRASTLRLRARQAASTMVIEVSDDGRGLDVAAIRRTALRNQLHTAEELAAMSPEQVHALIFAPGFSTSEMVSKVSGRGVGLDVVRTTVENLKGTIEIESEPGRGCLFRFQLPATLTTARVLIVDVNQRPYALPVEFVEISRQLAPVDLFTFEGRQTVSLDGHPVPVVRLGELLELPARSVDPASRQPARASSFPCVFLTFGRERLGLIVDGLVTQQEVLLKPFGPLLRRVRNVLGATILGSGEICMVLNPQDLLRSARKGTRAPAAPVAVETKAARKQVILLAEDSMTTRLQEKRILEGAGYEVVTAVDGVDAFTKLATRAFDAVVSDVEMPNLDGLGLTARIRQEQKYRELPIILVTSLSTEAHKRAGVEAGASAYLTKPNFDQKAFLETLKRLL